MIHGVVRVILPQIGSSFSYGTKTEMIFDINFSDKINNFTKQGYTTRTYKNSLIKNSPSMKERVIDISHRSLMMAIFSSFFLMGERSPWYRLQELILFDT